MKCTKFAMKISIVDGHRPEPLLEDIVAQALELMTFSKIGQDSIQNSIQNTKIYRGPRKITETHCISEKISKSLNILVETKEQS